MEKTKNKAIKITTAVLLIIFVLSLIFSVVIMFKNDNDRIAYIYSDGKLIYKIDLNDVENSYTLKVEYGEECYNIIEVKNGSIGVIEASCPDKICMQSGFITNSALPVTCLPNKMIIKIEGKSEDDPDVIV